MLQVEPLEWDTQHFGCKIGRLEVAKSEFDQLHSVLARAREQGFQLLYVLAPTEPDIDQWILSHWGGRLVDRRVDYCFARLSSIPPRPTDAGTDQAPIRLIERREGLAEAGLIELAVIAGNHSRFFKDTKIEKSRAKRLFEVWIEKSATGSNGEKVWIAIDKNDRLAGALTISLSAPNARIGLIAVYPEYQGLGIGKRLIAQSKQYAFENGVEEIKVATQEENNAANGLYLGTGFRVDSVRSIYHFWLRHDQQPITRGLNIEKSC
jgi:dTDP-4-amino-4,6-dideoxy-D-galactose acyltransferase